MNIAPPGAALRRGYTPTGKFGQPQSIPSSVALPNEKTAGLALFFTMLLIFTHFGRPFEKFLIGFRIPAVICAICIVVALATGSLKVLVSRGGFVLAMLLAWMLVCAPFSSWRGGSVQYVLVYMEFWLVLFLLVAAVPKSPGKIIAIFATVACACCFQLLISSIGGSGGSDERFSMNGTFGNSDDVALLAGYAIPFVVAVASSIRLPVFRYGLLTAGVGYLLLVTGRTATRAAIPALVLMVIVYFMRGRGTQKGMILSFSVVALICAAFVLPKTTLDRFATLGNSFGLSDVEKQAQMGGLSEADASLLERKELVQDAIKMALDHPVFGVGPGEFTDYRTKEMKKADGTSKPYLPSHNTFLQVASEAGFIGIGLYVSFLVSIYLTILRIRKLNQENVYPDRDAISRIALCLEAALAYFVVCAAFMTCDRHPHQFILAGGAIALERILLARVSNATKTFAPAFPRRAPKAAFSPSVPVGIR